MGETMDNNMAIELLQNEINENTKIEKEIMNGAETSAALTRKRKSLPLSVLYMVWEIIVAIAIVKDFYVTPLEILFNFKEKLHVVIRSAIVNLIFAIDILLFFLNPYIRRSHHDTAFSEVIQQKFSHHYIFVILSVVLLLPFDYFEIFDNLKGAFFMLQILRVFWINRLFRLFSIIIEYIAVKLNVSHNKIINEIKLATYIFLMLTISIHLLAAFWAFFNELDSDMGVSSILDHMINYYYFITTTISSVGYGDFSAKTECFNSSDCHDTGVKSYVIAFIIEFVGVCVFFHLIWNLKLLFYEIFVCEFGNKEMKEIDTWIIQFEPKGIEPNNQLLNQVHKSLKTIAKQRLYDTRQSDFFSDLTYEQKILLTHDIYIHFKKLFGGFFSELSELFSDELLLQIEPYSCPPGLTLLNRNHNAFYLYFIVAGTVVVKSQVNGIIRKLKAGQYFGDFELIDEKSQFEFYVKVDKKKKQKKIFLYRIPMKHVLKVFHSPFFFKDKEILRKKIELRFFFFNYLNDVLIEEEFEKKKKNKSVVDKTLIEIIDYLDLLKIKNQCETTEVDELNESIDIPMKLEVLNCLEKNNHESNSLLESLKTLVVRVELALIKYKKLVKYSQTQFKMINAILTKNISIIKSATMSSFSFCEDK